MRGPQQLSEESRSRRQETQLDLNLRRLEDLLFDCRDNNLWRRRQLLFSYISWILVDRREVKWRWFWSMVFVWCCFVWSSEVRAVTVYVF